MSDEWRDRLALTALIVGLIAVLCILVPACGVLLGLCGVILGLFGLKSERRVLAIIGMAASVVGLIGSVAFMMWEYDRIMSGEHPFVRPPGARTTQEPASPEPSHDAGADAR